MDVLKSDKEQNPERLFIDQENAESLEDKLYSVLSDFEKMCWNYICLAKII